MSSDTTTRPGSVAPADPAELRAEIARTRDDLGVTAAALAARTDVRARLRGRAAALADAVRRPVPVAVIAAVASATTVALVLIRRSRR
ncbi:DUF3618 domain-containing protein [Actinoplanes sp. NPDC049599]|uniref:DUF3618 domain-containing protein n=1 Tax=Actinoplanes sp. NPDC049599 TaxID=3363903 RepID=UPI0037887883